MAILTAPRSLQNADPSLAGQRPFFMTQVASAVNNGSELLHQSQSAGSAPPHSNHPPFFHLVLLVFEAVLEVVCVSLPGYIAARQGMFDADAQKLVANLNVTLFTPCLGMVRTFPYI